MPVAWAPSTADVARQLRARTQDDDGNYLSDFTDATRPTGDEVTALIDGAVEDVAGLFTAIAVPVECQALAKRVVTLKTALYIELSYFPEQAQDNSPYLQLRAAADQATSTLIAKATALDAFGEAPAPVNVLPADGLEP